MIATNVQRLVRTRLAGVVAPPSVNRVVTPTGQAAALPGQGGVVLGINLGDPACGWAGDHVEPGLSITHPDPLANAALRRFACVGNAVTVLDGSAAGARGTVFGKHGAVLAMLAANDLARVAPGDRVAIEALGVGLAVADEPNTVFHSCSPTLMARWITGRGADGRLPVPVAAVLPPVAAAAGLGMPAAMFNIDLNTGDPDIRASAGGHLRFGDIVALLGQDHRYGRRPDGDWLAVGVIAHGESVAGGHGFGMMTLLTAPASRVNLVVSREATLALLLDRAS